MLDDENGYNYHYAAGTKLEVVSLALNANTWAALLHCNAV